jgi:quercetin dioxygenase-like cupin family protein
VTIPQSMTPGINPAEEAISVGGLAIRFLLTGESSCGSVAAFEMVVPGGKRVPGPTHSHEAYEETVYGISGVLKFTVDGERLEVGPGQALCIPRGAVHRFDNDTAQDAKVLCVITPAILGPEYFREISAELRTAGGGPPDHARIIEIMLRHGLKPVLPPA